MSEGLISVIDVANHTGKLKSRIFKILKRLSIEPTKMRSAANGGQMTSYITNEEFRLVISELEASAIYDSESDNENEPIATVMLAEQGVFYLLLLEPDYDPGRFKVGFAVNLPERLRTLRCSAPFIKVVRSWPCKRLWEKTAIECVTEGCDRLHTEVFRTNSLEAVIGKCEKFFDLMPKLSFNGSNVQEEQNAING